MNRYTLWYQTSCPQPSQPFFTPTCVLGNLKQIFSGNEFSYMFVGSNTSDPIPYTRYQFLLQAENSKGGINSSVSHTIETTASSMSIY